MNEPKRYCPNCKREVIGIAERGSLYCPDCWNKLEQSESGTESENMKEPGLLADLAAAVRAISIVLLVLLGIFLVFLAFVYAACSGMRI